MNNFIEKTKKVDFIRLTNLIKSSSNQTKLYDNVLRF
jgi:hypothetical protein